MSDAQIVQDMVRLQPGGREITAAEMNSYEFRLARHGLHVFHKEFYEECKVCQAALAVEVMAAISGDDPAPILGDLLPPSKWKPIKKGGNDVQNR